ncbi:NifB/NifX family molybdenum-iron cluster-binding protein [Pararhodospirillum oryzae]|uniref:Nitrogen fixation n=1 Tax=Pararhodospirillum oryzae TaxID=478448 RepID=A0A512H3S7_9PROT|nr:NifB/NifX family molybdenum-iron cluster-binding protein [Pararhodospirillum oryzae]GEO80115.1 nitrogen fixation [Pararhodospirillum oryzae]
MRIAISTMNFRTVSAHAGRARRFLIYETTPDGEPVAQTPLQLPPSLIIHDFHCRGPHPLDDVDVLITAGCGMGFVKRMGARGVSVLISTEPNPDVAARLAVQGALPDAATVEGLKACHG